ncbi:MAG TPA: hypothetical protein VIY48_09015 [Candidatus Paceibacterota bacterium]
MNSLIFDGFWFVTLTYRYCMQDWQRAYQELKNWYKSESSENGPCCVIWRKELQKRGAIHFHLFITDPPAGWSEGSITDGWLHATNQDGDIAARLYGADTRTFDALGVGDAGIIATYIAKYASKEGFNGNGKQWGILGRRYARQEIKKAEITPRSAELATYHLVSMGAHKYQIDGGGFGYRLYLGHMGSNTGIRGDDPHGNALQNFLSEVEF